MMKGLLRALGRDKPAAAGAAFLVLAAVAAVFAPWIAPYDPDGQNLAEARRPPSAAHPFGTDFQGADVFSKVIYGARPTLAVAVGVSILTVGAGFALGVVAAYRGGFFDRALMRIVDVMLAFPALLLNIILVAVMGAGLASMFLALTLTGWTSVARIARGVALTVATSPYCLAARALGAADASIVARHIVPNCASTMVIVFAMRVGATILAAAGLNYLGLGAPSETNAWGTMVSLGQYDIVTAWWWPLAPATAIGLTVLSVNLLADAARDWLDPRAQMRLTAARTA
jgi:peptide/nickel transport system permease protein